MKKSTRFKTALLWIAGLRILLGIVAIPLAPLLYEDNFLILVLMRPTKEVLLAGGFLARKGQVDLLELIAAALPLSILGVWHFYWLGRGWATEIKKGEVPGIGSRLLPTDKIKKLQGVLKKKGPKLVFMGRLAAFPSAMVAAAAGSSKMPSKQFLPADGLGAVLALVEVIGAGYLLGEAYNKSKPWLTAVGVAVLVGLVILLGRYLRKE
ncbi:MAG TPA: VTT domain-containing protein [Actinomycetota bacterium]|nr:VTT domain-containing protein [Actinomycetota bacterium]